MPNMKISEVKATLQLTGKSGSYLRLRKDLAAHMSATGWRNKTYSGEVAYDALCSWLSQHRYLKGLRRTSVNRGEKSSEASEAIGKAFQALIADVGAKECKSAGASDRNFRTEDPDEAEEEDEDEEEEHPRKRKRVASGTLAVTPATSVAARPPVHVHMVDPDAEGAPPHGPYPWFGRGTRPAYTRVLAYLIMRELVNLARKHMAPERAARDFYGAIETPGPAPANAPYDVPYGDPACVQLTDAEEVEAWVSSSNARPLRVLVVLHRTQRGIQTPPPPGFPYVHDQDYTMLDMPAEDSDHDEKMRVNRHGMKVAMPRTDEPFQRLIRKIVIRRDRQQTHLDRVTTAYLIKYPDGIIPANPLWSHDRIWTADERAGLPDENGGSDCGGAGNDNDG